MYSNLKSDEKRRQEVISCLYWSLMQNWNIPQSMQDYFGLTEDYRLYHQLEDMDPAIYRQKRAAGEIPDVLEVDARLTRAVENIFESIWKSPVCVTPEAQVPLTLESKFRMTPIKS